MTERAASPSPAKAARPPRKPLPRRPKGLGVLAVSLAAFLVAVAILAWRMSIGEDPALGAGTKLASSAASPKPPVIERRIVKISVVQDPAPVVPVDDEAPPVDTIPAPAPVPPPVATPAPAPAPAPPVTASS